MSFSKTYGTTCHHMGSFPDSGKIVACRRFEIDSTYDLIKLREKTLLHTLQLFYSILDLIIAGDPLPQSKEVWSRPLRRQSDFQADLMHVDFDMSLDEIIRRLRAVSHPRYAGPFITLQGERFTISANNKFDSYVYGKGWPASD